MLPFQVEKNRQRQQAVQAAIRRMESNPDYPIVRIQIYEEVSKLGEISDEACQRGTDARLAFVLLHFEIDAEAHLRLVTDMASQKDYITLLDDWTRKTWEKFTCCPFDFLPPLGDTGLSRWKCILDRAAHWVNEGNKRLVSLRVTAPIQAMTIGKRLRELRERCRMTIEEVAEAVEVSARTVERHESGNIPSIRSKNLLAYEKLFSKRLGKEICLDSSSNVG